MHGLEPLVKSFLLKSFLVVYLTPILFLFLSAAVLLIYRSMRAILRKILLVIVTIGTACWAWLGGFLVIWFMYTISSSAMDEFNFKRMVSRLLEQQLQAGSDCMAATVEVERQFAEHIVRAHFPFSYACLALGVAGILIVLVWIFAKLKNTVLRLALGLILFGCATLFCMEAGFISGKRSASSSDSYEREFLLKVKEIAANSADSQAFKEKLLAEFNNQEKAWLEAPAQAEPITYTVPESGYQFLLRIGKVNLWISAVFSLIVTLVFYLIRKISLYAEKKYRENQTEIHSAVLRWLHKLGLKFLSWWQ